MTRRLACLAALLVVALPAAPAHADRASKATIVGNALAATVVGGVAVAPSGDWTAVWAPLGAGAVRVSRHVGTATETRVVQAGARGIAGADVELTATGEPQVAWADKTGIWAVQPFVDGAVPFQVSTAAGQGARIVRLADGRLAIYAAVRNGTRSDLLLAVGDGTTWDVRTLRGSAPRQQPYTAFDLAATTGAGVAMLRTERGRLRLETVADVAGTGTPSVVDLGIASVGNGRLFSAGDGVLHVLYGGLPAGARAGTLRYGTLGTGGRFGRRVLLRNLQCDPGGYQVGVGVVGSKVRLLYGYGFDIGWAVNTTAGRIVLDPFSRFPKPAVQSAYFSGSAGGRIAVFGATAAGKLAVQFVSP